MLRRCVIIIIIHRLLGGVFPPRRKTRPRDRSSRLCSGSITTHLQVSWILNLEPETLNHNHEPKTATSTPAPVLQSLAQVQ